MPQKPLEILDQVAADAGEIWCLCYVKTKSKPVQLKLMSRRNQASLEASACYETSKDEYKTEREDVATIRDGVLSLAKKWKGKVDLSTFKAGAKKSPVRGEQLEALLQAVLYKHFEGKLPKDLKADFDYVANKFIQGDLKKITRAPASKEARARKKARAQSLNLPACFAVEGETNKCLLRLKKRVSKDFSWTKKATVSDAMQVAYWLHLLGRDDEAVEAAAFLESYEFAGNYNIWSSVESALALLARYERRSKRRKKHKELVARIRETGFVDSRLEEGSMLDTQESHFATSSVGVNQQVRGIYLLSELCTLREMGGSKLLPTKDLEKRYTDLSKQLCLIAG